jgi:hypothetical protein
VEVIVQDAAVEALSRVAVGGTALDPEIVTRLLRASRRGIGIGSLTARERDVLALVLSERSVEKHIASIFSKLDLAPSDADHRRVLAVLRYLHPRPATSPFTGSGGHGLDLGRRYPLARKPPWPLPCQQRVRNSLVRRHEQHRHGKRLGGVRYRRGPARR